MSSSKLIEYNTWANQLIITQLTTFPPDIFDKLVGGSFGSIKAIMVHLLESDYLWLNRWKGIPLAEIPAWQFTDVASLEKVWTPMQNEMLDLAGKIQPGEIIKFITRKGAPYDLAFSDIVAHVSHHGSYHRGQITNMIRDLGQKPVSTDYFLFCTKA